MTDVEWIAAVRKYALDFGTYNFSVDERQRMLPYVTGDYLKLLHSYRYIKHMNCNLTMTFDLLNAMERGMVEAVTGALTR